MRPLAQPSKLQPVWIRMRKHNSYHNTIKQELRQRKGGEEMFGELSISIDASFPATEVWEVYSTLTLIRIIKDIPKFLVDILIDGDGSVGTVVTLLLPPDSPFGPRKEMFTKIDNHTRTKHVDVIEGGYLNIGFTFFRTRFEIIEKDHCSSIIKSSMLFELQEEHAANASLINVGGLVTIANAVLEYLEHKNRHHS